MNCAPCFDMARKSLSPFLSIDVTSFRSTTHFRLLSVRWIFFQGLLSSLTHKPTKRPCRIHRFSVGVSLTVILNTFTAPSRVEGSPASQRRVRAWGWEHEGSISGSLAYGTGERRLFRGGH